jgi:hypothetical protein
LVSGVIRLALFQKGGDAFLEVRAGSDAVAEFLVKRFARQGVVRDG